MDTNRQSKTIFAVAGGKGGVGKSIFSVALGTTLALQGERVALVDLDLGAANVHTYLGITGQTATIADFILKRVATLEEVLIETSQKNLRIVSGAAFVPGMANPAHWMKLKMMRHITALPAEVIIIDLGAGVHFNTLDFFGMADRGIVVTAPEPGAVMNAYGFIKGALFRKLQNIFRKHPDIGPIIDEETKKTAERSSFSLEWLKRQTLRLDPDVLPLIQEIEKTFWPALVMNRVRKDQKHVLVSNLVELCEDKLGLVIEHTGNLPDIPEIADYLLNIPVFIQSREGRPYRESVQAIAEKILPAGIISPGHAEVRRDFSDSEIEQIVLFMESLDASVFSSVSRNAMKLKMYFKPAEVVQFLVTHGVRHELFFPE
jgi:flagellar biosynthesis protein FlhG